MPMTPFYTKFPELAAKETRVIHIRGQRDLPDGDYGFVEVYCDEADCDCRRVILNVMTAETGPKVWATINYGWESLEFYERWMRNKEFAKECHGPTLDPLNPQTEYSRVLLQWFKFLIEDEAYVERLKRHYFLFKGAADGVSWSTKQRPSRRRRVRRRK
jgi:hypothetical protein